MIYQIRPVCASNMGFVFHRLSQLSSPQEEKDRADVSKDCMTMPTPCAPPARPEWTGNTKSFSFQTGQKQKINASVFASDKAEVQNPVVGVGQTKSGLPIATPLISFIHSTSCPHFLVSCRSVPSPSHLSNQWQSAWQSLSRSLTKGWKRKLHQKSDLGNCNKSCVVDQSEKQCWFCVLNESCSKVSMCVYLMLFVDFINLVFFVFKKIYSGLPSLH